MIAKRAIDLAVSAVLLVLTSPLWVVVAAAIRLTSSGPVLHRAARIGKDGVPFTILKFRTMRVAEGPAITSAGDTRITPVGRLLRRLKIDELPQLINVIRGDMSLVGPRPEDPRYVASYTEEQRRVLSLRPGLTSPAALAYRDEERLLGAVADAQTEYVERIMPAKLAMDLEYVARRSLALDVSVLVRTAVGVVVRPRRR